MIKIIIDNVYARIEGASQDIEFAIWNELSFQVEEFGQEHIKRRHLYNRKTKKTYTGLIDYVKKILDDIHEEYEIVDTREKHTSNANFNLVSEITIDNGQKIPFGLRPYQQEIIDRAQERECIQAATGAGKTAMMAALIAKFNVKPVSVFADKLTLCTQIKEEFEKFLGVPVGIVGGGMNQREDITVYSIQSATEDDVKDSKMIMFDECLTGDTLVTLADGSKERISDLVDGMIPAEVLSYNTDKKIFEPKQIYNWRKIPLAEKNKKMVRLTIEDEMGKEYTIECTEDHKIWIQSENCYIEAGKLASGMEVICKGGTI